jgi:hypothetical protein
MLRVDHPRRRPPSGDTRDRHGWNTDPTERSFSGLFFDEGPFDRRKSLSCRCLRRSGELFTPTRLNLSRHLFERLMSVLCATSRRKGGAAVLENCRPDGVMNLAARLTEPQERLLFRPRDHRLAG